ncbi:ABC transporter substrate-binding protein [Paenibacillus validus]|uniref:ABC transporter substrate-binding protein n=1 Tax=Paenibacillus TaxID=44249 RepID=UPI000FD6BACA|nr:ABC transporter substrate-binding protein [Paenibacillus validus]MED4601227.1 ABC transporter substrate-binding protein [Paenibacillus validus]MED4606890.1 ABC transporter substrate-binding protein [Paenibacillus validus]
MRLTNKGMQRSLAVVIAAFLLFLTACGSNGGSAPASSGTEKPAGNQADSVKVGVLLTFSGPFATVGEGLKRGLELYFELNNHTVGGKKVELVYEDDENNPQVALRKYHKLVDEDKIDLLIGMTTSTTLYALRDQIDRDKKPLIVANAGGNDSSWDKKSDYIYRAAASNYQQGAAISDYIAKNVGKKAYIVSYDNPAGREQAEAFKSAYEAAGGQVMQMEFPKVGTNDFAGFMTQIAQAKPDVVYNMGPSTDGMRFAVQFKEFGLKDKIALISTVPTDLATTPEMIAALDGVYGIKIFKDSLDNPATKKFMEAFTKKHPNIPPNIEIMGYDSAMLADKAIEKAGSTKAEDLIQVMKNISLDSPRGKFQMDPKTNNPISDFFVQKFVVKDGKLGFEYLDTMKDVGMPEKNPFKK